MPIKPCPKPFIFTDPQTHKKEGGTVHQQELIEHLKQKPKDYYKVAELLEWQDGAWSIRLGYYLKPHGAKDNEWQWGSQTTSIIDIESIDNLIKALTSLKGTYERMRKKQST